MSLGKLGDAAKKVNNEDSIKGVHPLTEKIKEILQEKRKLFNTISPFLPW